MKKKGSQFKLIPLKNLLEEVKNHPKRKTVWKGINEGTMGYIFGPSKSGKTTLAENLAMSLSCGKSEFFGFKLLKGEANKVLVISFEENAIERAERASNQLKYLSESDKELVEKNYYQPDSNFTYNLTGDADWILLKKVIKESEAKIVVIDSLTRLYAGSIEDSKESQKLTLNLRKLQRELNITVICIHHSVKNQKILTQDSMAGSRVVLQECDFAIGVNKTDNDLYYVKDVLYRYAKKDNDYVQLFEINDNQWLVPTRQEKEFNLYKKSDGRVRTTNLSLLEKLMNEIHSEGTIKSKDLVARLVNTGKISKPTLYSLIEKLIEKNKLVKISQGVFKLTVFTKDVEVSDD